MSISTNIIRFSPDSRGLVTALTDENKCNLISFNEVRTVFYSLGAQEEELPDIEESLNSALNDLDHEYLENCVKENLNIGETLMEKIAELSDCTQPVHVPYELIVESLRDAPENVKILCNPELSDSPKEILKRILNSSYEDYGEPYDLAE